MTTEDRTPVRRLEKARSPRHRIAAAFALVMSGSLFFAAPLRGAEGIAVTVTSTAADPLVTSLFHRSDGWVGGDGAYSVRLSDDKVLWTFGDSWIGKILSGKRSGCTMINNSAAIQSLLQKQAPLRFYWGNKRGKPRGLWLPPDNTSYYWPGDAAMVDEKLYMFLHVIKPKPDAKPPFQFEQVEDLLMQVDNPLAAPTDWRIRTASLRNRSSHVNFGVACTTDERYLYAYCSFPAAGKGFQRHPTILARIDRSRLAALNMKAWEYWCRSSSASRGAWKKELSAAAILLPDGAPEMSVSRVNGIPGMVATYMPPFSRKIYVRHAPQPQGPWGKAILAYSCPEREKGILLYSAKAHPEQPCKQGELVVTYCRNSENLAWHISRPEIYFPQAIIVRLKEIIPSGKN